MKDNRIAFILTGGAGKGAYCAGVLKALAYAGVVPDLVVGCSSGALNGAFAAAYTAAGEFTAERVESDLLPLWLREGTIWNMLRSKGIESLRPRNLFTLGSLAQMLELHLAPMLQRVTDQGVQRAVRLMVSLSDLRGCPCRVEALPHPVTVLQFAHYAGFTFKPPDRVPAFEQLQQALMASSAIPFLFAPVEMETGCIAIPSRKDQPAAISLFADGGLIDNAPLEPVMQENGITEIYMVSPYPFIRHEGPIEGFGELLTRFMEVLLARNLLSDLNEINRLNERKVRVESYCEQHGVQPSDEICRLAGFSSLKDYLKYRNVNLHLLAPQSQLSGHALSGFWDAGLRQEYISRGYEDGLRYLVSHLAPAPSSEVQAA